MIKKILYRLMSFISVVFPVAVFLIFFINFLNHFGINIDFFLFLPLIIIFSIILSFYSYKLLIKLKFFPITIASFLVIISSILLYNFIDKFSRRNFQASQITPITVKPDLLPTPLCTATPSPLPPIDYSKLNIRYTFLSDNEVTLINPGQDPKPLTSTDHSVFTFDSSPDNSVIAYITGKKSVNDNYISLTPDTVFLLVSGQNPKIIYSQKPSMVDEGGYLTKITDVSLSPDNNLLAITTSDSIFIYDIKKDFLSKLYSNNQPASLYSARFYEAEFSPDQKRLLLTLTHYEGQSTAIFDLSNNSLIDTGYFGYGEGALVLGWLSPEKLIGQNYGSGKDTFFWFTPDDFTQNPLFQTGDSSYRSLLDADNQKIYYRIRDKGLFYFSIETGQSVPIEEAKGFSIFDLSDNKDHLIFSKDVETSSKLSQQIWAYNLTDKKSFPILKYFDNLR